MATETKPHPGDVPITVDEYSDLKQSLKQSEMRMHQLLQSNTRLGEEVALLQNMASCCSCAEWDIKLVFSYVDIVHSSQCSVLLTTGLLPCDPCLNSASTLPLLTTQLFLCPITKM